MPNPYSPTKKERKKGLSLIFPRQHHPVDNDNLWFQWEPPDKGDSQVVYRLSVYLYEPGTPLSEVTKKKPVYQADNITTTFYKVPKESRKLRKNTPYCWRIEVRDKQNRNLGTSILQSFMTRPKSTSAVVKPGQIVALPDRSKYLPHAPFVFGYPVKRRLLASLPEPAEPSTSPSGPGTVEPQPLIIWGDTAARLYLVPSLVKHAHLTWDYRDVDGCEKVLLQIAGPAGFTTPNAEDARADTGVRTWYEGPNYIDYHTCGEHQQVLGLEGDPPRYCADDLDLQCTNEISWAQDFLYLRLVPLDGSGNQLPLPASDHVWIHCVDYPGMILESCEVEWIWGEEPRRRFHFTIQLLGEFPSTLVRGSVSAPFTLIIRVPRTTQYYHYPLEEPHPEPDIIESPVQDVSLTCEDGTDLPRNGVWDKRRSYFKEMYGWESGARYTFTLEQVFPRTSVGSFVDFLDFIEANLQIYCIPGLTPDLLICEKTMLEDEQPILGSIGDEPCVKPLLYALWKTSGLDQLYDLFTRPLSGRRVHPRDGEQEVSIRFVFPEPVHSVEDLYQRIGTSPTVNSIIMVETIDGREKSYNFWCTGFWAVLNDRETGGCISGRGAESGHVVFNPPDLQMHFWCDGGPLDYYLTLD